MSIILDALKKSESDRQRQSGPALFEVKITPPKAQFPVWAIAIAVLLGVNMIIVGWLLLRRPHSEETAAAPASITPPAGTEAPGPLPAITPATTTPAMTTGGTAGAVNISTPGSPPGVAPAQWPPAAGPAQATGNTKPSAMMGAGLADRDVSEPTLASTAREPAGAGNEPAAPGANPDDFTPATEPPSASLFKGHVRRGTESGFMLYQDATLVPGSNLPQLRLDLHVYAGKPQDRFALINMHKMHEGDSLPDGTHVESITTDGVVLSKNGSKFLLPRD